MPSTNFQSDLDYEQQAHKERDVLAFMSMFPDKHGDLKHTSTKHFDRTFVGQNEETFTIECKHDRHDWTGNVILEDLSVVERDIPGWTWNIGKADWLLYTLASGEALWMRGDDLEEFWRESRNELIYDCRTGTANTENRYHTSYVIVPVLTIKAHIDVFHRRWEELR